ncbi:unnamed protein product [Orchesella dallaii]|uniref:Uncharacterized protein n=1 Tax=Orchesella dallaii TaxID=48710 RepID=A0ABP1Q474_9HEXA
MHFGGIFCVVALVVVELISSGVTIDHDVAAAYRTFPFSSSVVKGSPILTRFKREQQELVGNEIAKAETPVSNITNAKDVEAKSSSVSSTASSNNSRTVKIKTLVIPDRSPANISSTQLKEDSGDDDENKSTAETMPGDTFDEKAVQRTIIVIAGIAVIIVAYLGIKFVFLKKRKVIKRYGRLESSEMDLLDQIEDDEESEEEEELFDISQHSQRRS